MYFNIPVEMCSWALKNKFVRPFQVYIVLKSMCSGKIHLKHSHYTYIKKILGLKSERAVINNLKILMKHDWIGYNANSGYYFIRGFNKIPISRTFRCRTIAEFKITEIKKFKAFIAGAVIGYLINQQKRRKWLSERNKARSKHLSPISAFYPAIGNNLLAEILNISSSTASEWKQLAKKGKYIKIKKHYDDTGYRLQHRIAYMRMDEENSHRIRIRKNKLMLQGTDEVETLIHFKSKKIGKNPIHI